MIPCRKKVGTPQASQLTTKVSIGSAAEITSGLKKRPKRGSGIETHLGTKEP
jgi:hypothetical protein